MEILTIKRGEVWWCDLPAPIGNRPVLVLQGNHLNNSDINTIIVAVISSDMKLLKSPGNVLVKTIDFVLPKNSVVKVTQILTVEKEKLYDRQGALPRYLMNFVEKGVANALLI